MKEIEKKLCELIEKHQEKKKEKSRSSVLKEDSLVEEISKFNFVL